MKELTIEQAGMVSGGYKGEGRDFGAGICKGVSNRVRDNTCGARALNDRLKKSESGTTLSNYDHGYPLRDQKNSSSNRPKKRNPKWER